MADDASQTVSNGDDLRPLSEIELSDRVVWGLVDSAPDGLVMVDHDGRIVLLNRQTEELFGYDRGELLGQSVDQLLPEEQRQVHRAHRTRYRAEPRVRAMGATMDLQGRRSDGSLFPVEISLSPLEGDGDLLIIAAVRDISNRVAAQAFEAEVRHGLDVVEDGVFMFDAESLRFRYVNQGAVEQVGYSREELLSMTPLHIKPEYTEQSFRDLLEPLLSGERPSLHFTTTHRRRDGSDLPVEIVLQSPDPESTGADRRSCVALVRDISQRLEDEHRLAAAQQQASLLEDRERMAREMHDTVIQELFATGMALQATLSRVKDQAAAERILAAVDSIDGTIKQIRGTIFSLQNHGQRDEGVRNEVLRIVESTSEALGFEPSIKFDGLVDTIPDPVVAHLLPTLREALTNVARHAGATEARVTVAVTGTEIVLEVADNGAGISGASPRRLGGNGLRNMHERALSMGGGCEIASQEDEGTTVVWRVPHETSHEPPPTA